LRLLLDTNVLIWTLLTPDRLLATPREAIEDGANEVFVSIASPWEIAIKRSRANLNPPNDLDVQLTKKRFSLLPISLQHTRAIESLPHHHGDPFDRMLVAQAQTDGLTIVTSDRKIARYQVAVMRATRRGPASGTG
jgi:PIN domain nuclease of toxin-antitoxin system